jgi:hypothetical protein
MLDVMLDVTVLVLLDVGMGVAVALEDCKRGKRGSSGSVARYAGGRVTKQRGRTSTEAHGVLLPMRR